MNFNILSNLRLQMDSNEKWKQVIINDEIMNICKHNGNFKYIQKPLFSVEEPPEGLIHVNYPRYIITCDGKIYSIVLKEYLVPKLCKAGYQYTLMSNKGRQQDVLIHSIVATL